MYIALQPLWRLNSPKSLRWRHALLDRAWREGMFFYQSPLGTTELPCAGGSAALLCMRALEKYPFYLPGASGSASANVEFCGASLYQKSIWQVVGCICGQITRRGVMNDCNKID